MRVVVVYKDFSDYSREVHEWMDEFTRRSGRSVEEVDPESMDGETFCRARDIVEYPTIVVIGDEGKTYEQFSGRALPQIDTVMAYAAS